MELCLRVPPKIAPTEAEGNRKRPSNFTFGKQNQDSILARLFMYLNSPS